MEKGTQAMVGCCPTRVTRGLGKTNEIYATFSQRIKLALSFIDYKMLISQEAKAKKRKTSAVKGRLITRENPTMCCQEPGCEKTFLKYYVDKRGLLTRAKRITRLARVIR